jgi:predicted secreted protein
MTRPFLIAIALCLVACDQQAVPDFTPVPPPSPTGDVVRVRPTGERGQVELAVGQTLALEMQSHFEWQETAAPTLLRRDDILWGAADRAGRDQAATGADNWQVFVYRALEPGEDTLDLVEARSWEPENIAGRYTLTVRVLPAAGPPHTPPA